MFSCVSAYSELGHLLFEVSLRLRKAGEPSDSPAQCQGVLSVVSEHQKAIEGVAILQLLASVHHFAVRS